MLKRGHGPDSDSSCPKDCHDCSSNLQCKAVLLSVDIIVEHAKDVETDVIVRHTTVGKWKFMTVKVLQCRRKKEKP